MKTLAIVAGLLIAFVCGLIIGVKKSEQITSRLFNWPLIRIKRYTIGTKQYHFSIFTIIEDSKYIQECDKIYEIVAQADQMQEYVQTIVGLVVAYDLEEFQTIIQQSVITANIESMADNINKLIRFLRQPNVIVEINCKKAIEETISANQPMLINLKTIHDTVVEQANGSERQILHFYNNSK